MKKCISSILIISLIILFSSNIIIRSETQTTYLEIIKITPSNLQKQVSVYSAIIIKADYPIIKGVSFGLINLWDSKNAKVPLKVVIKSDTLIIQPSIKLEYLSEYHLCVPRDAVSDSRGKTFEKPILLTFQTSKLVPPSPQYMGRFDFSDKAGAVLDWPGSTIRGRFKGNTVSVKMLATDGESWFQVIIDGKTFPPIRVTNKSTEILISNKLKMGPHKIELIKRTEASVGNAIFRGFVYKNGIELPPDLFLERKIEFIGDSIMCGYGNESLDPTRKFTPRNENNYYSFSSVAARQLRAEQVTVAKSGMGIFPTKNVPKGILDFYSRTVCEVEKNSWNFKSWFPHVVVINMCANDLKTSPFPSPKRFVEEYLKLIKKVRSNYVNAYIICTYGIRLSVDGEAYAKKNIEAAVENMKVHGDKKIVSFRFPPQDTKKNGAGEEFHPSKATHQEMANMLAEEIKKLLNWS
ncbi:MAG: SGNH/GDSL hydrolase family protein [Bacillota bacterium]